MPLFTITLTNVAILNNSFTVDYRNEVFEKQRLSLPLVTCDQYVV